MNCAFTICTQSYLRLANTLKRTFQQHNPGFDFYIVVIDIQKGMNLNSFLDADLILRKRLSDKEIVSMKFKYSITEYSTSVKPFSFMHFFDMKYDLVAYFDPDILFLSEFQELKNQEKLAFVTPHHIGMRDKAHLSEEANTLNCGVYNCGFIAFRNHSLSIDFVNWWGNRLIDGAFEDLNTGLYTDQKWIDFLPVHMADKVDIVKNLGCNFAPWNFKERFMELKENTFIVMDREDRTQEGNLACFIHFSGFNYNKLQDHDIEHSFRDMSQFPELNEVLFLYGNELKKSNENQFTVGPYIYGTYTNGTVITKLNRRLYRKVSMERDFENPFDANGEFYLLLKRSNLILNHSVSEPKKNNVNNMCKKLRLLRWFYRLSFKVLGADRYSEMLKALQLYSVYEEQDIILYGGR